MFNKKKNTVNWNLTPDQRIQGELETAETKRHKAIYRVFGAMPVVAVATTQAFQTSGFKSAIAGFTAAAAGIVIGEGIASWHRNQEEVMNLQQDDITVARKSLKAPEEKKRSARVGLNKLSVDKITHGGIAAIGTTLSGCIALAAPDIFKIGVEAVSKGTGLALAAFGISVLGTLYGAAELSNDFSKKKRLTLKADHWKYV